MTNLKNSPVEFEGTKLKVRQLVENSRLLNAKIEELTKLNQMGEKQMEDALIALQVGCFR